MIIFTLDLITRHYPVITAVDGLPYDCTSIAPCSPALGGVVILASNSIIYVDQASRRVILPVNGWPPRISDMHMPTLSQLVCNRQGRYCIPGGDNSGRKDRIAAIHVGPCGTDYIACGGEKDA